MSIGTIIHHVGTFFVLVAFALLVVPDVTAPSVHHLSLFRVTGKYIRSPSIVAGQPRGTPVIDFGSFGYCVRLVPDYDSSASLISQVDSCYDGGVGYSPAGVIDGVFRISYKDQISSSVAKSAAKLTKTFVIIPLATATAFVAFLLALLSSMRPSRLASVLSVAVSVLTFCLSLIAFICGMVTFAAIQVQLSHIKGSVEGHYSVGMWSLLTAMICSLIGSALILFTCCSGRKNTKRDVQFAKAG